MPSQSEEFLRVVEGRESFFEPGEFEYLKGIHGLEPDRSKFPVKPEAQAELQKEAIRKYKLLRRTKR